MSREGSSGKYSVISKFLSPAGNGPSSRFLDYDDDSSDSQLSTTPAAQNLTGDDALALIQQEWDRTFSLFFAGDDDFAEMLHWNLSDPKWRSSIPLQVNRSDNVFFAKFMRYSADLKLIHRLLNEKTSNGTEGASLRTSLRLPAWASGDELLVTILKIDIILFGYCDRVIESLQSVIKFISFYIDIGSPEAIIILFDYFLWCHPSTISLVDLLTLAYLNYTAQESEQKSNSALRSSLSNLSVLRTSEDNTLPLVSDEGEATWKALMRTLQAKQSKNFLGTPRSTQRSSSVDFTNTPNKSNGTKIPAMTTPRHLSGGFGGINSTPSFTPSIFGARSTATPPPTPSGMSSWNSQAASTGDHPSTFLSCVKQFRARLFGTIGVKSSVIYQELPSALSELAQMLILAAYRYHATEGGAKVQSSPFKASARAKQANGSSIHDTSADLPIFESWVSKSSASMENQAEASECEKGALFLLKQVLALSRQATHVPLTLLHQVAKLLRALQFNEEALLLSAETFYNLSSQNTRSSNLSVDLSHLKDDAVDALSALESLAPSSSSASSQKPLPVDYHSRLRRLQEALHATRLQTTAATAKDETHKIPDWSITDAMSSDMSTSPRKDDNPVQSEELKKGYFDRLQALKAKVSSKRSETRKIEAIELPYLKPFLPKDSEAWRIPVQDAVSPAAKVIDLSGPEHDPFASRKSISTSTSSSAPTSQQDATKPASSKDASSSASIPSSTSTLGASTAPISGTVSSFINGGQAPSDEMQAMRDALAQQKAEMVKMQEMMKQMQLQMQQQAQESSKKEAEIQTLQQQLEQEKTQAAAKEKQRVAEAVKIKEDHLHQPPFSEFLPTPSRSPFSDSPFENSSSSDEESAAPNQDTHKLRSSASIPHSTPSSVAESPKKPVSFGFKPSVTALTQPSAAPAASTTGTATGFKTGPGFGFKPATATPTSTAATATPGEPKKPEGMSEAEWEEVKPKPVSAATAAFMKSKNPVPIVVAPYPTAKFAAPIQPNPSTDTSASSTAAPAPTTTAGGFKGLGGFRPGAGFGFKPATMTPAATPEGEPKKPEGMSDAEWNEVKPKPMNAATMAFMKPKTTTATTPSSSDASTSTSAPSSATEPTTAAAAPKPTFTTPAFPAAAPASTTQGGSKAFGGGRGAFGFKPPTTSTTTTTPTPGSTTATASDPKKPEGMNDAESEQDVKPMEASVQAPATPQANAEHIAQEATTGEVVPEKPSPAPTADFGAFTGGFKMTGGFSGFGKAPATTTPTASTPSDPSTTDAKADASTVTNSTAAPAPAKAGVFKSPFGFGGFGFKAPATTPTAASATGTPGEPKKPEGMSDAEWNEVKPKPMNAATMAFMKPKAAPQLPSNPTLVENDKSPGAPEQEHTADAASTPSSTDTAAPQSEAAPPTTTVSAPAKPNFSAFATLKSNTGPAWGLSSSTQSKPSTSPAATPASNPSDKATSDESEASQNASAPASTAPSVAPKTTFGTGFGFGKQPSAQPAAALSSGLTVGLGFSGSKPGTGFSTSTTPGSSWASQSNFAVQSRYSAPASPGPTDVKDAAPTEHSDKVQVPEKSSVDEVEPLSQEAAVKEDDVKSVNHSTDQEPEVAASTDKEEPEPASVDQSQEQEDARADISDSVDGSVEIEQHQSEKSEFTAPESQQSEDEVATQQDPSSQPVDNARGETGDSVDGSVETEQHPAEKSEPPASEAQADVAHRDHVSEPADEDTRGDISDSVDGSVEIDQSQVEKSESAASEAQQSEVRVEPEQDPSSQHAEASQGPSDISISEDNNDTDTSIDFDQADQEVARKTPELFDKTQLDSLLKGAGASLSMADEAEAIAKLDTEYSLSLDMEQAEVSRLAAEQNEPASHDDLDDLLPSSALGPLKTKQDDHPMDIDLDQATVLHMATEHDLPANSDDDFGDSDLLSSPAPLALKNTKQEEYPDELNSTDEDGESWGANDESEDYKPKRAPLKFPSGSIDDIED